MKLFRRFVMVFLPLIIIGAIFLFFPELRPDTSEFRELRRTDFSQGIEISKKPGGREVKAYVSDIYVRGFEAFDVGKVRIAMRSDSGGRSGWMAYAGSTVGYTQFPILITPPRNESAMSNPPPAPGTAAATPVGPAFPMIKAPPATPTSGAIYDLPGGTRIDVFGTSLAFENGEVEIDGQIFSTIDKPLLIVLREDLTIEMVEELKPDRIPADQIVP